MQSGPKKAGHWFGARAYIQRNWRRALQIREKIKFSEETFHLFMAGGVGVIGGLVNVAYHQCMLASQMVFTGHTAEITTVAENLPSWMLLVIPTVGGLAAGACLYWGLRLIGKQGSTDILEVVVASDGGLPFRTGLVKTISSLVSIGSGGSIGREGGIVNFSATVASKWGQVMRWQPYRLRLLVACGAASGISAAYNAPIAGAVFSALIVVGNFSMNIFAPLVFSSVVAYMVSCSFLGMQILYKVEASKFTSLDQLPWFVILGLIAGAMGAFFLKMLRWSEDLFKRLPGPIYLRTAAGGLVVGLISLGYPRVWGNGSGVINELLQGQFTGEKFLLLNLVALFFAKLLATLATVGSGAVGGVFTPTLFLGAGLGAVFGTALRGPMHTDVLPFVLVGMSSMLAATTRSPLLAIIMVFEISLDYTLMPPLMIGAVVATVLARRLHPDSIYTEPLRRKGLELGTESQRQGTAIEQTVGDFMRAPVTPVRETATLQEIATRFLGCSNNFLPVVDARQQLIGLVALQDLKEYLTSGEEISGVIAYDVMRPAPPCLTPNQLLLDTLPIVLASEQRNVPVVNSRTENRLVGAVVRAEVLGLLSEAIANKTQQTKAPTELSGTKP